MRYIFFSPYNDIDSEKMREKNGVKSIISKLKLDYVGICHTQSFCTVHLTLHSIFVQLGHTLNKYNF